MMKKKTARLTLLQEATNKTKQGETKKQKKKQKTHVHSMTKSATLTLI